MPKPTNQAPLTPVTTWRRRRRQLRNWLMVAAATLVVAHTVGLPHLRWEYGYSGPRKSPVIHWGVYAGTNGLVRIEASDRPHGCPLIVFLKPSRPLWGFFDYLQENET